ncbi:hypothetical protein BGZ98_000689 [Dissophora globulifera]|nr:hypothetical protein BGZ98_000689 [Dissophora globulifera]
MAPTTLYRFTAAEGLVHLLSNKDNNGNNDSKNSAARVSATPLAVRSIHDIGATNRPRIASSVSNPASLHQLPYYDRLFDFDHLVCDFDETITNHDTTSSFDKLATRIRQACSEEKDGDADQENGKPGEWAFEEPQMSWSEILQAYLDDLEKVDVTDLCHLNEKPNSKDNSMKGATQQVEESKKEHEQGIYHPQPTSLNASISNSTMSNSHSNQDGHPLHQSNNNAQHPHPLNPSLGQLQCHLDGRTFTPEPEPPVPKIPSLQPWIHSQVRKRAVEKVSLDRVYESGNLVGLTKLQIRNYGRHHIKLRPGMVEFLKAFVDQNEKRLDDKSKDEDEDDKDNDEARSSSRRRRGELWILSVNWSKDLIRGAMDQIFGSEEATERYLPDAHLISSNLQFLEEDHELLMKRKKSVAISRNNSISGPADTTSISYSKDRSNSIKDTGVRDPEIKNNHQGQSAESPSSSLSSSSRSPSSSPSSPLSSSSSSSLKASNAETSEPLTYGEVKVHCLTGTDKLRAFRKMQRDYAAKHSLALSDTKWAYLGDSVTDLGCLVEADVGIIIGENSSLLGECERSGIQVVDITVQERTTD